MPLHPQIAAVTDRIVARSEKARRTYLDRMDAAQLAFATDEASLATRLDRIEALLAPAAPLGREATAALPAEDGFAMRMDALRADLLAAITEAELATAERLVQLTTMLSAAQAVAPAAPALTPRPSPLGDARPSATAAPRPVARPDNRARQQAPAAQPNPFRYP